LILEDSQVKVVAMDEMLVRSHGMFGGGGVFSRDCGDPYRSVEQFSQRVFRSLIDRYTYWGYKNLPE
jgi:hypothetical protein